MSNDEAEPQRPPPADDDTSGDVNPVFEGGDDEPDFADEHDDVTVEDDPMVKPGQPDEGR